MTDDDVREYSAAHHRENIRCIPQRATGSNTETGGERRRGEEGKRKGKGETNEDPPPSSGLNTIRLHASRPC
eukprot:524679-Pyramimonas_sp.AAC.1